MKISKAIFTALLTLTLFTLAIAPVAALDITEGLDVIGEETEQGETDLVRTVGRIIQTVLGFLGLIALILFIVGGFKWMTSGGNEENVSEAKKLMSAAIVGLLIIFIAYGATLFIINKLSEAADTNVCKDGQYKCTFAGTTGSGGAITAVGQVAKCINSKWGASENCSVNQTCTLGKIGAAKTDVCE